MERIKHVFLLFAILFCSVSLMQAQQPAPPQSDLNFENGVDIDITGARPSVVSVYFAGCENQREFEFQAGFSGNTGRYTKGENEGDGQQIEYELKLYWLKDNSAVRNYLIGQLDPAAPDYNAKKDSIDALVGGVDILGLGDFAESKEMLNGQVDLGSFQLPTLTLSGDTEKGEGAPLTSSAYINFAERVIQNPGRGVYVLEARWIGEEPNAGVNPDERKYDQDKVYYNRADGKEIVLGLIIVQAEAAFEVKEPKTWNLAMNQFPAQIYENKVSGDNDFAECLFKVDSVDGIKPGCIPNFYIDIAFKSSLSAIGTGNTLNVDVLKLEETTDKLLRVGPFTGDDLGEDGCVPTCLIMDALNKKDLFAQELGLGIYTATLMVDDMGEEIKPMSAKPIDFEVFSDWGYKVDMNDWDLRIATPAPSQACQYKTWGFEAGLTCNDETAQYSTFTRITYAGKDDVIGLKDGYFDIAAGTENCKTSIEENFSKDGKCQSMTSEEFKDAIMKGCGDYGAQLFYCDEITGKFLPASEKAPFEICAKYPVTIPDDSIKTCIDPICPEPFDYTLNFQNERVIESGKDEVCVAFYHLSGDALLVGENYTLNGNKSTQTWFHSVELNANTAEGNAYNKVSTDLDLTFTANGVGTGTYLVYTYADPHLTDLEHELILGIDTIVIEIDCCDPKPLTIDEELVDLPEVVCADDTTKYVDLRALYDGKIPCEGTDVEFIIEGPFDEEGNLMDHVRPFVKFGKIDTISRPVDADKAKRIFGWWPGGKPGKPGKPGNEPEKVDVEVYRHQLLFAGEGKGTFHIFPVTEGLCGPIKGDSIVWNLDVVKPFTQEMYEQNGKVFYKTNGNTFDILPLSNDSIPVAHEVGTALSIYDPNKLVAYVEDANNPFYFDWRRRGDNQDWIDIVSLNADTTETGLPVFNMPTLYLENGTEVQEPLAVYYQYFYQDRSLPICCDDNVVERETPFTTDWFILEPWANATVFPYDYMDFDCVYGKFFIIVKPNDDALDNNLVAEPVVTDVVCYTEGETIDITFDAVYDEKANLENGKLLPTYYAISYEVRYVGGDDILDYASLAADTVSYEDASLAVTWSPVVKGVGMGTYMVTPYYVSNDLMSPTHTRGVATVFTVKSRQGFTTDMVGINNNNFIYKNGDVVPAISLDTNLPEGAIVSWYKVFEEGKEAVAGEIISGNNIIPSFIATNITGQTITSNYEFVINYVDGLACASDTGSFSVQVIANIIEDLNLTANPVADTTVCYNDAAAFNYAFSAEYYGREAVTGVDFRVEFAHGDNIVDLAVQPDTAGLWAPKAIKAGQGTYRVVPTVENGQGQAVTFTLTAIQPLTADIVGVKDNVFTYLHGETVPAISLDVNLPEGAIVKWTVAGDAIGMNAEAGNAIVPSFQATNIAVGEADSLKAVVSYEVNYANLEACGAEGSFTIVVTPRQEVEATNDLAAAVAGGNNQVVCNGTAFAAMSFSSAITAGTEVQFAGDVTYKVEFIGGTPILDLTASTASAAIGETATWTPVQAVDGLNNAVNGTGTYRVTPSCNRLIGISTVFTLTTNPFIDNSLFAAENATYYNGDVVPAYLFDAAALPAGAVVNWKLKEGKIGSAEAGNTRIPSFVAVNTTATAISATYEAWVEYKNCAAATPVTFTITVEPKTLSNIDLTVAAIEDQTVCGNAEFEAIEPVISHKFGADLTGAVAPIEFVSGKDVKANADEIGTGIYKVTPLWNNYQGVSVEFALTRLSAPTVNDIATPAPYCNGDAVSVSFSSTQADTEFDWEVVEADNKLSGIAMSGTGSIDWASVSHSEATAQVITISVTPRNPSLEATCEGTAKEVKITINPTVKVNPIANILVDYPTTTSTAAFEIAGVADKYTYSIDNAIVVDGPTSGEIVAVDGKFIFPALKVRNIGQHAEPVMATVTVTPSYGECDGDAINFYIVVLSEMEGFGLEGVDKIEVCEGEDTGVIRLGVPSSSFYYVTWTGGEAIGLANSDADSRNKSIPSFVAQAPNGVKTTAQITVTPNVRYNGQIFDGSKYAISFPITVYPTLALQDDNSVEIVKLDLSTCSEAVLPVLTLTAPEVAGATYQWYKNNVAIASATKNVYSRTNVTLSDAGEYYCVITGEGGCGTAHSKTFKVEVIEHLNDVIVEQTFADVLQVDNSDNQFVAFNWFYADGQAVSYDEGFSWIRINSADLTKAFIVKATDRLGKVHISCEKYLVAAAAKASISAFQQEAGSVTATVTGMEAGSIQMVSATGSVVSTTAISGSETTINVPSAGIYVLRAIPANEGSTAEVKVIVK